MNIITTAHPGEQQRQAIYNLWNNEYPARIAYTSIAGLNEYLGLLTAPMHYLLVIDGNIKGWAFTFVRDGEQWFAIILNRAIHGQGFGSQLLDRIKTTTDKLNGWVADKENEVRSDGSLYKSPLQFYLKNGFVPLPEMRLETEKISAVKIEWVRK